MPHTLQFLLDNLGIPPREVALDWARQILQLPSRSMQVSIELDAADQVEREESATAANGSFDWQLFQVANSGELALLAPPTDAVDSASVNAFCLLHAKRLFQWGAANYVDLPADPSCHVLAKAIDAAINELSQQQQSEPAESLATVACVAKELESKALSTSNLRKAQADAMAATASRPKVPTPSNARPTSPSRFRLVAVCSIVGLGLLSWLGWWVFGNLVAANQASQKGPLSEFDTRWAPDLPSTQTQLELPSTESGLSTIKAIAGETGVLVSSDDNASSVTPDFSPLDSLSSDGFDDNSSLAGEDRQPDENSKSEGAESGGSAPASHATDPTFDPEQANEIASAAGVDVMAELGNLKADLDDQEAEDSTTSIPLTPSASLKLPALSIVAFPSVQTVRVDLPRDVRMREAQWRLSLRFVDGVSVAPAETQTLTRESPLFWKATRTKQDAPGITVNVGAQLIAGRTPTVRWQIMASSTEASGVALPLSTQYLSHAEALLANLRGRLEVGITSMNQLYSRSPKEMRSRWTTQRKVAESQLEICEKLFRFAVETRRITGLMDGQFEVHGQLIDVNRGESAVVATFGELATITRDE